MSDIRPQIQEENTKQDTGIKILHLAISYSIFFKKAIIRGDNIRILSNFSSKIIQARKQWGEIFKMLYEEKTTTY